MVNLITQRTLISAVLMSTLIVGANAQSDISEQVLASMAGTIDVRSEPYMTSGILTGCHLVFNAIAQDWKYRQGAYIKVSGNVGFVKFNNGLGSNLKVVLHDIEAIAPTLRLKPSPPSRAYLIGQNFQTNLTSVAQSGPSDTPGALFSVFQISPTFEIVMNALEMNKLTIAFNRAGGDSDLQIPLELDVKTVTNDGKRVRSEEAKAGFLACLQALMT